MTMPVHVVGYAAEAPRLEARWDDPAWSKYAALEIKEFHPQGSGHKPRTQFKLCYDHGYLYVRFRVEDRYVLARHTTPQAPVYQDSCVEAFVQPAGGAGYVNIETNAGGTMLTSHVTDPVRVPGGFRAFAMLTKTQRERIAACTTLPRTLWPEIAEPTTWELGLCIPFAVLTELTGGPAPRAGTAWRANFFKCADNSSHPHWGSWAPIGSELNFHQPERFGELRFG